MPRYNCDGAGYDIPLDLVQVIMEELVKEKDIATLKACSLACGSFRSICQRHIFATIKIDFTKRPTPDFWQLVKQNPAIASYVRSLDYIDASNTLRGAPVLGQFHRVNSFKFGFKNSSFSQMQDWEGMSMSQKIPLCSFIQANNIVDLYLFSIENLPMSLLLHFPALSSLTFYWVCFANSALPITFSGQEIVPRLSSLQVGNVTTLGELLGLGKVESRSILDLTQLNELSVQACRPGEMVVIKHILETTEHIKTVTLKGELVSFNHPRLYRALELSLGTYPALDCLGNIASALGSGSLKTLKTIQLYARLETEDKDPYIHLTKELEAIAGKNALEQIIINIEIEIDDTCTTDPTKWAQLDDVLSTANGFPFLRRVEVKIVLHCYGSKYVEWALVEDLRAVGDNDFPWLMAASQIKFGFDVSFYSRR